jgi:regulator of RNase E activity RraB
MTLGWDTYLYQLEDGRPAAITLDLDLTPAEAEGLPLLLRARLTLKEPADHGLMVEEETGPLAEAEEAFENLVDELSDGSGLFVGSLTMAGQCILHAYLPADTAIPDILALGQYEAQAHVAQDDEWQAFFEGLYPAEDQLQCIINRRIVAELEDAGEDLSQARETRHSAFFPNQNAARAFADGAVDEGYEVASTDIDADGAAVVHIVREESVDLKSINEATLTLVALAGSCGGYYDGWETRILSQLN